MSRIGRWLAPFGVVLAIVLFAREDTAAIVDLLRIGGWSLALVALVHVVPMMLNARAWQAVTSTAPRATFRTFVVATWVRESVNGLLPVARIGGEVAAFRMLVVRRGDAVPVTASLVVDVVASLISQSLFTLLSLVVLLAIGTDGRLAGQLAAGASTLFALGLVLMMFQGTRIGSRTLDRASRAVSGHWVHLVEQSSRLERTVQNIVRRRGALRTCVLWQIAGWCAGAAELYVALALLDRPASIAQVLVIEAAIQTVSSVAFVVPGALGLQEGGFLLVGAALGLDGTTSLALAASRRLRDVVVFFPGLLMWSWLEGRRKVMASVVP